MNLDHDHIEHPALGQVPTAGNRFAAILQASKQLHARQMGQNIVRALETRLTRRIELRPATSWQWQLVGEEVQGD